MVVLELHKRDYPQRVAFSQVLLLNVFDEEGNFTLFTSDIDHLNVNGTVSKEKCRYWAAENPPSGQKKPLHSLKVTVWCVVDPTS